MDEFADDFAFLCDDIIHDVLQVAHFERLLVRQNSQSILPDDFPIGGPWGEIAHKFRVLKLMGTGGIIEYRLDGSSQSFAAPANGRNDFAVNRLYLTRKTHFNEIKNLAADAYELLEVYCKVVPKEFFENLGNRFTKIVWFSGNKGQTEIDFLKRQLMSPHLRILEVNSPVLARPEFTDLLVDFVSKKNFENLNVMPFSTESISERVFLAAYQAWLQWQDREHLQSSISAQISTEDLRELTARIPNFRWKQRIEDFRNEWSYSERHPTADHYEMLMFYNEWNFFTVNAKKLTMSLSSGHI